jgi:hypothetical protein
MACGSASVGGERGSAICRWTYRRRTLEPGCGRAGWYSYDALDNGGVPSAPGQSLVLGDPAGSATWAFALVPIDEMRTRLLARSTGSYKRFLIGLRLEILLRPLHFGMQRRQLLNLKRNAEGRSAGSSHEKTARRPLVGIVLYLGSRRFAREEEAELSKAFGARWDDYCRTVMIPWL